MISIKIPLSSVAAVVRVYGVWPLVRLDPCLSRSTHPSQMHLVLDLISPRLTTSFLRVSPSRDQIINVSDSKTRFKKISSSASQAKKLT